MFAGAEVANAFITLAVVSTNGAVLVYRLVAVLVPIAVGFDSAVRVHQPVLP